MQHVSLLSFTFYANSFPPIRTQSILLTLTSLVILFLIFPLDSTVVLQLPATPPLSQLRPYRSKSFVSVRRSFKRNAGRWAL
jgi:hypothetical protein